MNNKLFILPLLLLAMFAGCDDKSGTTVSSSPAQSGPPPAPVDGIGIAIVVDHSGSMGDSVKDFDGQNRDKEGIARRSVMSVIQRCEKFAKDNPKSNVQVAVLEFDDSVARVLPFGPPDAASAKPQVDRIAPKGSTAIGDAVTQAKMELDATGLKNKHIIVVTDGENNTGAAPEVVALNLKNLPADQQAHVYVIAFDVNSSVFNAVKGAGWTVLSASNAAQLQQNLDNVLGDNILLERN